MDIGIFDAYSFSREKDSLYEDISHSFGKAAIVHRADKEFWEFFETTARNAGVFVKVFCSKEEAIEWLSDEKAS